MKKILLIIIIILLSLTFFVLYRFHKMEIQASEIREIEFTSKHHLSGSLYLPDNPGPYQVIIFIHGDGPADRTLDGGYHFIINRLLKSGYACFSYDKPGVGKSEGNWLNQSMSDRAEEVLQAIPAIEEEISVDAIGTLAFSQGGWVTSELALAKAPLDFYIVVGGAIDWMDQHRYYETRYTESAGFTKKETKDYLNYIQQSDTFISAKDYDGYADYVESHDYESPMSEERFHFVTLNYRSNATPGISQIQVPFLGIWGDSDQNVDALNSIEVYEKEFKNSGKSDYQLLLIKDANHELLDSKYNEQEDTLPLDAFLYGEDIFAEGALNSLVDWLDKALS